MSVKLVLLGMLKRGPQHGYELKSHIEQEMGDWTSIAFGSIYFALKKLTEDGFVEQTGHEQHGNRPSRIIYDITHEGEKEFKRLLMAIWTADDRHYFPLDIGMYFLHELDDGKRIELIHRRITETEDALKYLTAHKESAMSNKHVPPVAGAIFSHSTHHLEAELAWLREVEQKMLSGEY